MAFTHLARMQMLNPLGMLGELEALEDLLGAPPPVGPAAIENGVHALTDEGVFPL